MAQAKPFEKLLETLLAEVDTFTNSLSVTTTTSSTVQKAGNLRQYLSALWEQEQIHIRLYEPLNRRRDAPSPIAGRDAGSHDSVIAPRRSSQRLFVAEARNPGRGSSPTHEDDSSDRPATSSESIHQRVTTAQSMRGSSTGNDRHPKSTTPLALDGRAKRKRSVSRKESSQEILPQGVSSMPEISPVSIFREFCSINEKAQCGYDDARCLLLTKLFYAIGSPDALDQLRAAYATFGSRRIDLTPTNDIADCVEVLDKLDVTTHFYAILRRFNLIALCRHRDAVLQEVVHIRGRNLESHGRSDSVAHKRLMAQAYPNLSPSNRTDGKDDYSKCSKSLSHRLMLGQRWRMLSEAFAPGVLALVPIQGEYQLYNSDYERLPTTAIMMLVNVLKRYRGRFLADISTCLSDFASKHVEYPFTSLSAESLKQQPYDSPRLIELCKAPDPI